MMIFLLILIALLIPLKSRTNGTHALLLAVQRSASKRGSSFFSGAESGETTDSVSCCQTTFLVDKLNCPRRFFFLVPRCSTLLGNSGGPVCSIEQDQRQTAAKALRALQGEMTSRPRRLQIVSDLHLEFYLKKPLPEFTRHGDDLALLGDIGKPWEPTYKNFIEREASRFDNVFLLLGNHEYYHRYAPVENILAEAEKVAACFQNVHLLERSTFDLTASTRLLGATLWSDIDSYASQRLNDFRTIRDKDGPLTLERYRQWHKRDVSWLEQELERCRQEGVHAVVLTHHGPCQAMSGKFFGDALNPAFVTNLERLFAPPAIAFASGHVHSNCDLEVNGIRSVSNAKGYPGEATGYKEDVVIDIP
ncbi:Metallo-dependent phosphatase-like protein [Fimicolochytrium jonesii]|uniref:Metallo-dependent phosphatase-like protein n=1 Tax=Fimicolochytrium jonesii TaxID=1396493 RepID=UPI0022FDCD75|nr:Metallo-dependent phosphatase-like protein [Fimicolochytrium jonesii]KAI8815528.1 Metallo-dependent phosphatase-like protein [Fimicolochytrium jonesii]